MSPVDAADVRLRGGAKATTFSSNHRWRAVMTPERPRRADATDAQVETPHMAVSRADAPSALSDPGSVPLYAALDLGTNSCRMLIAQPLGSQFVIVDSFSKTVQLGVGLEATGRLSRSSMGRTIQALRICQKKLEKNGVSRMRLVATEACTGRATRATSCARSGARPAWRWRSSPPRKRRGWRSSLARRWSMPRPSSFWWWISGAGRPSWSGSTCPACLRQSGRRRLPFPVTTDGGRS